MRASATISDELLRGDFRLDGSYHASEGIKTIQLLKGWAGSSRKLDSLGSVARLFNGPRFPRIYVDDPERGVPFLSSSDMLLADLSSIKYLSKKHTPASLLRNIKIEPGWTLISCSGTIGNTVYVRKDMAHMTGSQHIMRAAPREGLILPGYLYAFLSSKIGYFLLTQGTYGAVTQHIEPQHIENLPIPRLEPEQEQRIHELIEQAAELRVQANQRLRLAQERFYRQVLGIELQDLVWKHRNEHAFAVGETRFSNPFHRLDGFHHVGYAAEAERYLGKTIRLGELVEPYQPPLFKRPYTGENGIPFLSGIDLYDYYPKPHMYISRKMDRLELYIVNSGTILVQIVGQRYGLFGRPTILPKHLNQCAVTQHLMRVYTKDARDRGFVYIWLSTEVGRRTLLKQSFGTSMGVLFERSFNDMPAPDCSTDLRHSFETEVQTICEMREHANEMEDLAQELLAKYLQ